MIEFIYNHRKVLIALLTGIIVLLAMVLVLVFMDAREKIKNPNNDLTTPNGSSEEDPFMTDANADKTEPDDNTECDDNVVIEPEGTDQKIRIWIGESRVVYWLKEQYNTPIEYQPGVDYFIAKGGCGFLNFYQGTDIYGTYNGIGFEQLDQWLAMGIVESVFFITGINDAANTAVGWASWQGKRWPDWWADTINGYALAYPEVNFIYGNIGPVSGDYGGRHNVTKDQLNTAIDAFNEEMLNKLSQEVLYVNLYQLYQQEGFVTADGIHYLHKTNQLTYDFLLRMANILRN